LRLGWGEEFRARSPERDAETDHARVSAILDAVQHALHSAAQEQSGLHRRVEDVLARAAVTQGNAVDEYLEPPSRSVQYEIANGQRRLRELSATISHFRFLKVAILSRFPDFKASPAAREQAPTARRISDAE
jgi:hypothetical protein